MSQPVREDEEGVVLSPTIVLPKAVQLAMRHLKVTGFTWQPGRGVALSRKEIYRPDGAMSGPYWLPHTDKISLIDNFETDAVAGTARATCHYFPGTFPGHFPGNEIAPGLFFVGEAAAQAFGLLVRLSAAQELAQKAFWPTNIQLLLSEGSQVKPFAMIRPDQPITAYVYWDKGATDAKSVVGKVVLLKDNRLAGSAVIKGLPVSVNPESPEQVQVIILDR